MSLRASWLCSEDNAPLLNIPGRTHPVEIFYTSEPERDPWHFFGSPEIVWVGLPETSPTCLALHGKERWILIDRDWPHDLMLIPVAFD